MALIASHIIVIIILMMMTVLGIVGRVKCACLVAIDHTCRDIRCPAHARSRGRARGRVPCAGQFAGVRFTFGVLLHVHTLVCTGKRNTTFNPEDKSRLRSLAIQ